MRELEIEVQIRTTGESDVLDDIKTRMEVACWCQTTSPQGRCCLGLVSRVIEDAKARLAGAEGATRTRSDGPGKVAGLGARFAAEGSTR